MPIETDLRTAGAALARGDASSARAMLQPLLMVAPHHPGLRQALGVAEARLGQLGAAEVHLREAVRLSPRDPRLRNSLANILDAAGLVDAAVAEYEAAISLDPGYLEPRNNLGLTLRSAGELARAAAVLRSTAELAPQSVAAWLYLGLVQLDLGEREAAALALDRALSLDPDNPRALEARARAEADLGGDALPLYRWARRLAPGNAALVLGEATALHRAGSGAAAIELLAPVVRARPDWREGLSAMAQLRWQWGETDYLRDYRAAMAERPDDQDVRSDYLTALSRSGRYAEVLEEIDRGPSRPALALIEAAAASETEDMARADRAFQAADQNGASSSIAHVRRLLRRGQAIDAATMAQALAAAGDPAAWSYLATAWRLVGDARGRDLEDPAYIGVADLDDIDLTALAARLRALHVGQRAPFDQTIRGGRQTDGDLFHRREPEIAGLRRAVETAVAGYIEGLPSQVEGHPLLGVERQGFRFAGSWSVRLDAGGFHSSHTHPRGWISSACYVVLPPAAVEPGPAGRLVLGAPPPELGLDLAPIATIDPAPGRLVLFPSYLWHGTNPFPAGERITVAFDVAPRAR